MWLLQMKTDPIVLQWKLKYHSNDVVFQNGELLEAFQTSTFPWFTGSGM